jgi:hypothetical protein
MGVDRTGDTTDRQIAVEPAAGKGRPVPVSLVPLLTDSLMSAVRNAWAGAAKVAGHVSHHAFEARYEPSNGADFDVLVVEDHPVNRELLIHQLHSLGLRANGAADGIEAIHPRWIGASAGAILFGHGTGCIHRPRSRSKRADVFCRVGPLRRRSRTIRRSGNHPGSSSFNTRHHANGAPWHTRVAGRATSRYRRRGLGSPNRWCSCHVRLV